VARCTPVVQDRNDDDDEVMNDGMAYIHQYYTMTLFYITVSLLA